MTEEIIETSLTVKNKPKQKHKKPKNFAVILHNDNYTPMDFVVWVLRTMFNRTEELAERITQEIHTKGLGVAGVYHFEIAEQKAMEVSIAAKQNEFPLQVSVEEVGA
jgi:ATP-dependent Clp protease adaptor protein ClpS